MDRILNSSLTTDVEWRRPKDLRTPNTEAWVEVWLPSSMRVVAVGAGEAMGNWDPTRGVELVCGRLPRWYLPQGLVPSGEFKFVVMQGDRVVVWEEGENRSWHGSEPFGTFRGAPHFAPRMSGAVVPVFSIRAAGCEGIGDFTALGDFAVWAASVGMKVVQTLPVNDTTITHTRADSYPYKSISVFALHPLYVRVAEVDPDADLRELHELEQSFGVDYDRVDLLKWRALRAAYARLGAQTLESDEFLAFFAKNQTWLRPYAVFSYLRDEFQTASFAEWPEPYCSYTKELEERICREQAEAVGLYYFLQFHADRQLRAARDKARAAGVAFKGDIPIGVSRDSVEVWSDPQLFHLDGQAGAPPDAFSADGQNWGFPTYNWQAMARDGYAWWRARFEKMADYFDAYRIDHILGFFRIWEIPVPETSGLMGHFSPALPFSREELAQWGLPMHEERYLGVDAADRNTLFVRDHTHPDRYHPRIAAHFTDRYRSTLDNYEKERFDALYTHYFYHRHNDFWASEALAKLPPLIDATRMLCCAEDLGMIPACVPWVLDRLQVATLEIERMPKDSSVEFAWVGAYPYRSVATTSTHDMATLRGWWTEDRGATQRYYNHVMGWWGEAPAEATPEVCLEVVARHLACPAMAVVLPIQDWVAVDGTLRWPDPDAERINVPADPNHYWRYRLHLSVEQLRAARSFNEQIKKLNQQYQR